MARPPKNAEGPSATERMESAFWDCMGEMPFSEITVRDIVGRAKVNRNSYYYHYDSMWDLAHASCWATPPLPTRMTRTWPHPRRRSGSTTCAC